MLRPRSTRIVAAVACASLAFAAAPWTRSGGEAGPATRALTGSAAPGLQHAQRLGDVDPATPVDIVVTLPLRQGAMLDGYIAAVSDPRSARHGERLTSEQFTAEYGPAPVDVAAVTAYLAGRGLQVTTVSSNRTLISARGTAAQVSSALNTGIGRYHDGRSGDFRANDGAPQLPAGIAARVLGVIGLDSRAHLRPAHMLRPRTGATGAVPAACGPPPGLPDLGPRDVRRAYTLSLASGQGQSIALAEFATFNQANVTCYDTEYGITAPPPVVAGSAGSTNGESEVELDIEMVHALAPASSLSVYEAPNSDAGSIAVYNAMVNGPPRAESNSTSWGDCELAFSPSTIQSLHDIFAQAAAQGQSFVAASGDAGAFDCVDASNHPVLGVDYPASDPYVTGAGGTTLQIDGSGAYAGETAWSGSGGGLSRVFGRPRYQSTHDVARSGLRQVPDVALNTEFDASLGHPYAVFITNGAVTSTGWYDAGGTSAASPLWAAYFALLDQDGAPRGRTVGFANPQLYALRDCTSGGVFFHDVTAGSNRYYQAATGYDLTTGLGSFDGSPLPQALPEGYWMVASDGGIFSFGGIAFYGSTGALRLNQPIVGMAAGVDACGYWMVAADGGVFAFGGARFFGSTGAMRLNQPIVGMAATPDGLGYWLVASDGGIFSFGDARFLGSTGAMRLNRPIVGMAATPDGGGYWLVASDGGIFSFGDAAFYGSTGGMHLNQPIVAMATDGGGGYWLVASDGGIFSFGDAPFLGSTGAMRLNRPIVAMAATQDFSGYWLVAGDGGVFSFGDAGFRGSTGNLVLNRPVVGMAAS